MSAVPSLRFSGFDDAWIERSIGQLVNDGVIEAPMDGNHGEIHPKSSDYVYSGIPFVMANDLVEGAIAFEKVHFISETQARSLRKGFALEGDVLLSHKGSVGAVAYIDKLNTPFAMLTPQVTYYRISNLNKLSSKYLFAYFGTSKFQRRLKVLADGGTRPYIGITLQKELKVDLTSLPEQEKIADFLGAVDDKTAGLRERERLLTLYKKGVIQQIFAQDIRFKADDGSNFPDWEKMPLHNFLSERKEYEVKSQGLEHISLTVRGVVPKSERYDRDFLVTDDSLKKYKVTRLGDLCYNPANLKFGVISVNKYGDGIFSPIYVTFEISNANTVFLETFVTSPNFIKRIRKFEQGTVYERMAVSPSDFLTGQFRFPSLAEQQKIADFLCAIDAKITAVSAQITQMKVFKKGLLQQMFV